MKRKREIKDEEPEEYEPVLTSYHTRLMWPEVYKELENVFPLSVQDICASYIQLDTDDAFKHVDQAIRQKYGHLADFDIEDYCDDWFCVFCSKYLFSDMGGPERAECGDCMAFYCMKCMHKCVGFTKWYRKTKPVDLVDVCAICAHQ